jgi:hypothetical protein
MYTRAELAGRWQQIKGAVVIAALVALVCAVAPGCRWRAQAPTTQPLTLAAQSAVAHSQAAKTLIIEAKHDATPRSKPILIEAVKRTDAAIAAETQAVDEATKFQAFADASLATVKHLEQKLADEKAAGEARWQKEHDASKWIGWKTRAYLWLAGGMVGLGILLQILAPAMGLMGPIGAICGKLVSLLGHALTGFVSIVFGWVDAAIARVAAWVQKRDDQQARLTRRVK